MIRERVSTHGVIRPLEPESELSAFSLPPELIGQVSELAVRRYHGAKAKFDKKFHNAYKAIEKHRRKHLDRAQKDAVQRMAQLQQLMAQDKEEGGSRTSSKEVLREGLAPGWTWALDADEKPPPSSIVARRDTHEAVELARIADEAVLADEKMLSGNSLWSLMVNFLTVVPDKEKRHGHRHELQLSDSRESKKERMRSRFAQLVSEGKKNPSSSVEPAPGGPTQEKEMADAPVPP